jgi:hypothetical protein
MARRGKNPNSLANLEKGKGGKIHNLTVDELSKGGKNSVQTRRLKKNLSCLGKTC